MSTAAAPFVVNTAAELLQQPAEYQELVKKIIVSHAINELAGATVYDEPAIAFAPTPYWKWHACRIAMEEYGHHVRFAKMGAAIGVPEEAMIPGRTEKRALNIFDTTLSGWAEFCVLKMIGDLAEILQVEDLLECSYVPLRRAAKITMPEEKFHATFGERACAELVKTAEGRARRAGRHRQALSGAARVLRPQRLEEQRALPQVGYQTPHQRRDAHRLPRPRARAGREDRDDPARAAGRLSGVANGPAHARAPR